MAISFLYNGYHNPNNGRNVVNVFLQGDLVSVAMMSMGSFTGCAVIVPRTSVSVGRRRRYKNRRVPFQELHMHIHIHTYGTYYSYDTYTKIMK